MRLDAIVREKFQVSWGKARGWIETGKIWVDGRVVTEIGTEADPTSEIELKMNAPRADKAPISNIALDPKDVLHVDTQIIVVNKPSGLSTVPYDANDVDTLEQRVCRHLKQPKIEVVHRLDRGTSGLLVFARTATAAKALSNQFRFHTVLRRYFALVHGRVASQTFHSYFVENRGDGLRGSIRSKGADPTAKEAITHVEALDAFNGMTLVECRLETGRTHQIRIHLGEAGHPLLGETAYQRDFKGPMIQAPRLMLHAAELGFEHPVQKVVMRWTRLPPKDFADLIQPPRLSLLRDRLKA